MPSLETAHAELYLEVYSGLSAGYSSPSFPMVSVEESLAHLVHLCGATSLVQGRFDTIYGSGTKPTTQVFNQSSLFFMKRKRTPNKKTIALSVSKLSWVTTQLGSVLVMTGQSWPDFLCSYSSHLSLVLCSILVPKLMRSRVSQINMLKLFAFWQCQYTAVSACSLSSLCSCRA